HCPFRLNYVLARGGLGVRKSAEGQANGITAGSQKWFFAQDRPSRCVNMPLDCVGQVTAMDALYPGRELGFGGTDEGREILLRVDERVLDQIRGVATNLQFRPDLGLGGKVQDGPVSFQELAQGGRFSAALRDE